jgi:hypothetical protein
MICWKITCVSVKIDVNLIGFGLKVLRDKYKEEEPKKKLLILQLEVHVQQLTLNDVESSQPTDKI